MKKELNEEEQTGFGKEEKGFLHEEEGVKPKRSI